MSDTLYVNDNGTPVPLNLGTGIEYVQRIETLEQNAATQATKDSQQDAAISAAQTTANNAASAASAAQTTANSALDKANSITVPVTSVNGQTGAVTVGTVRSVNGVGADAAGNVANVVATVMPNVFVQYGTPNDITIPNGGTWAIMEGSWGNGGDFSVCQAYSMAGGSVIKKGSNDVNHSIFAIRIQ